MGFVQVRLEVVAIKARQRFCIIEDEFSKFPPSKQFTSWLRLAPTNKISVGKIPSNKILKGSNRLYIALCHAANAIGNLQKIPTCLIFLEEWHTEKRRATAVCATARKLAVILWNMITKKIPYSPPMEYLLPDQKTKLRLVIKIKKSIAKFELKFGCPGFADALLSASL